jgi:hypothetical protein
MTMIEQREKENRYYNNNVDNNVMRTQYGMEVFFY